MSNKETKRKRHYSSSSSSDGEKEKNSNADKFIYHHKDKQSQSVSSRLEKADSKSSQEYYRHGSQTHRDSERNAKQISRSREQQKSYIKEYSYRPKKCDGTNKRSISNKMMRPASDDEDNSSKSKLQTTRESRLLHNSWRKKKVIDERGLKKDSTPPPNQKVKETISVSKEENAVANHVESLPVKILTDQELNKLAAKLTKAELLGNDVLVKKLKEKLASCRLARDSNKEVTLPTTREEEVLLTKAMPSGYTMLVTEAEHKPAKRKSKMIAFLEENRNLKQMFEHEKGISAQDENEVADETALQMGALMEDDYDDMGGTSSAVYKQVGRFQDKQRQRAIQESQLNEKSMDSCNRCMTSQKMQTHLIVALGKKCYVALLSHEEMANGQCVIVPMYHVQSSLLADEDLWEEIMDFRKALVKFYQSRDEGCIFFETYLRSKSSIPHMVLHCIPLPREVDCLSPIYFKKAIDECEAEWAQNKKLVNLKGKGVRNCVPKGLSYFFVDFGCCPGYAHVIEDERTFPRKFAEEIVAGMLDVESFLWLRPPNQSFDVQCKKVVQFTEAFKPFDPRIQ